MQTGGHDWFVPTKERAPEPSPPLLDVRVNAGSLLTCCMLVWLGGQTTVIVLDKWCTEAQQHMSAAEENGTARVQQQSARHRKSAATECTSPRECEALRLSCHCCCWHITVIQHYYFVAALIF
eukprot:1153749-Pelagomonas_calceolata.AAC.3